MSKKKRLLTEEEQIEKKRKTERFIFRFVNFTLWASVVIIGVLIFLAPSEIDGSTPVNVHPKTYYTLMFVESILGIICMNLPRKLEKSMKVMIPSKMLIPFVIFLYCSIFLGEVRSFYYHVPHWDTFLHFFSAGMLGSLAFSLISILNRSSRFVFKLTPGFIALFAFCFAVTCGTVWEIYEFTFDGILGLNMQKFMTEDGVQFIGRNALMDTMKDIITDVVGAGLVSLFGYFSMCKHTTKWVEERQLRPLEPGEKTDLEYFEEGKATSKIATKLEETMSIKAIKEDEEDQ